MKLAGVVGWVLLVLGPIFCLAWLAICFIAAFLNLYDNKSVVFVLGLATLVALIGLFVGVVSILGGWFMTHPTAGVKIRKPVGWSLLFFGLCGVGWSIVWAMFGFSAILLSILYFGFMVVGGYLLVFSTKRRSEIRQAALKQPTEPDEESANRSGGL
jgi:hypothetical protein